MSIDEPVSHAKNIDTDIMGPKDTDTEVIGIEDTEVIGTDVLDTDNGFKELRMSENKRPVEAIPAVPELLRSKRTKTRQGLAMADTRFASQHNWL